MFGLCECSNMSDLLFWSNMTAMGWGAPLSALAPNNILFCKISGVSFFDATTGVWMVHSVPGFPPVSHYEYPSSGSIYGQSFLCISLNYADLEKIGRFWFFSPYWTFSTPFVLIEVYMWRNCINILDLSFAKLPNTVYSCHWVIFKKFKLIWFSQLRLKS